MKKKLHLKSSKQSFFLTMFWLTSNMQGMNTDNFIIRTPNSKEIRVVQTGEEAQAYFNYCKIDMETAKKAIREYSERLQKHQLNTGEKELFHEFNVTTAKGIEVSASFFDRKSSILIVAGQGFQHSKRAVYALAALYPECDIITFNYRWTKLLKFACKFSTLYSPLKQLLLEEHEEVSAIVDYMKTKKNYKEIVGHAICYSSFPFLAAEAHAQARQEHLFDKIIVDSAFATTEDIFEKVVQDPFLFCKPQVEHMPNWIKSILCYTYIPQLVRYLTHRYANASIPSLLQNIKNTPIMLVHGQHDVFVPFTNTFDKIWNAASKTTRFAYLTPFEHVMNLPKNRGLYKRVCELFIHSSPGEFSHHFPLKQETIE